MNRESKGGRVEDKDFREALSYLYSLQKYGIKLGLENMRRLLAALGNPENAFRCIHVAGTNGKGSTSAAIAGILRAAGNRTGLFTSPHLMNFTERIIVDGKEISEQETVKLALSVRDVVGKSKALQGLKPTFFEFVTVMALMEFRQQGVQWAVLETGMGGRLDATNVVAPAVSVITPVGIDHARFLGRTLREIASEKAGIIKPGVPVVLGPQKPACLKVFEEKAAAGPSPLWLYGRDFGAAIEDSGAGGVTLDYRSSGRGLSYPGLFFPLAGDYQASNAAVAVRAAQIAGFEDAAVIRGGLKDLRLPGRLELAGRRPEIRLDGAHNPEAARALAGALKGLFLPEGRRLVLVLGIMADKDVNGIMKALLPLAWKTVFTAPAYGRAMGPGELLSRALALVPEGRGKTKTPFSQAASVKKAVLEAGKLARAGDLIVITGSFYTAGEAKMALKRESSRLSRLREVL